MWAAQNPNRVQQIAQVVQEAVGGPPGALIGAVGSASRGELSIARKLVAEGKNVEVLATGASRTADFDAQGLGHLWQYL